MSKKLTVETQTLPSGKEVVILREVDAPAAPTLAIPGEKLHAPNTTAKIEDIAAYAYENQPSPALPTDDIVTHEDLMVAFANFAVGEQNLSRIWDRNVSKLMDDNDGKKDPGLEMAENRSATGLATTTLHVMSDDQKNIVPVHVVMNTTSKKTLIVGESASSLLKSAFDASGIAYVDRNSPGAPVLTELALRDVTAGQKPEARTYLKHAFGYRHETLGDKRDLSAQLLDRKIEPLFEKFVVKKHGKHAL